MLVHAPGQRHGAGRAVAFVSSRTHAGPRIRPRWISAAIQIKHDGAGASSVGISDEESLRRRSLESEKVEKAQERARQFAEAKAMQLAENTGATSINTKKAKVVHFRVYYPVSYTHLTLPTNREV